MSDSIKNLRMAFAGESQANRKYLAFAKQAEQEGYTQAAKLFRAAAEAETVHAHNHLSVMGGIRSTADNLQAAFDGEVAEFREMYPEFIEQAKREENSAAKQTFQWANEVEKIHARLYKEAMQDMNGFAEGDYFVCQRCGNTVLGAAPDKCSICGASREMFIRIS
jgi:rubrerythrin